MIWVLIFYVFIQVVINQYEESRTGTVPPYWPAFWPITMVWRGVQALKELNNMEETE